MGSKKKVVTWFNLPQVRGKLILVKGSLPVPGRDPLPGGDPPPGTPLAVGACRSAKIEEGSKIEVGGSGTIGTIRRTNGTIKRSKNH